MRTIHFSLFIILILAYVESTQAQDQNQLTQNNCTYYRCRIESEIGDTLKLDNGGIVLVTSIMPILKISQKGILLKKGAQWKIFLEGKKCCKCELLKEPMFASSKGQLKSFSSFSNDENFLIMTDGSRYQLVQSYFMDKPFWIGLSDVLILNDSELCNLNGYSIVNVKKVSSNH